MGLVEKHTAYLRAVRVVGSVKPAKVASVYFRLLCDGEAARHPPLPAKSSIPFILPREQSQTGLKTKMSSLVSALFDLEDVVFLEFVEEYGSKRPVDSARFCNSRTHLNSAQQNAVQRFIKAATDFEDAVLLTSHSSSLADAARTVCSDTLSSSEAEDVVEKTRIAVQKSSLSADLRPNVFARTNLDLKLEFLVKLTGLDFCDAFKILDAYVPDNHRDRFAIQCVQVSAGLRQHSAEICLTTDVLRFIHDERRRLVSLAMENATSFLPRATIYVSDLKVEIGSPMVTQTFWGRYIRVIPVYITPKNMPDTCYFFAAYNLNGKWYRHGGTRAELTPSGCYEGWDKNSMRDAQEFSDLISKELTKAVNNFDVDYAQARPLSEFGLDSRLVDRGNAAIAEHDGKINSTERLRLAFRQLGFFDRLKPDGSKKFRDKVAEAQGRFNELFSDVRKQYTHGQAVKISDLKTDEFKHIEAAKSLMQLIGEFNIRDSVVTYALCPVSTNEERRRANAFVRRLDAYENVVSGRSTAPKFGPYLDSNLEMLRVLVSATDRSRASEFALAIVRNRTSKQMSSEMSVVEKTMISDVVSLSKQERREAFAVDVNGPKDISAKDVYDFIALDPAKREFLISRYFALRMQNREDVPLSSRYEILTVAKERLQTLCALADPNPEQREQFLEEARNSCMLSNAQLALLGLEPPARSDDVLQRLKDRHDLSHPDVFLNALGVERNNPLFDVTEAAVLEVEFKALLSLMNIPLPPVPRYYDLNRNPNAQLTRFPDRSSMSVRIDSPNGEIELDLVVFADSSAGDSKITKPVVDYIKQSFSTALTMGWIETISDVKLLLGKIHQQLLSENNDNTVDTRIYISLAISLRQDNQLDVIICGAGQVAVNGDQVVTKISGVNGQGVSGIGVVKDALGITNLLGHPSFDPQVNRFNVSDNGASLKLTSNDSLYVGMINERVDAPPIALEFRHILQVKV